MGSSEIRGDMQEFQASVKKLSDKIGRASVLWNDAKFSELSSSVGKVASQLKEFMVYGDRACMSIDRFDKIASEQF